MTLRTQMAMDVLAMMNPDEFGEPITYLEPGREPKAIHAIVQREPPEVKDIRSIGSPAGGTVHGRTVFQIYLANHEMFGMTSIRKGQDKVQMKKGEGDEDDTDFVVSSIIGQDPGGWRLEVTA